MKTTKQILTILIASYMLLAMGGLSIFHHLCSCNNQFLTSVLVEQSCCASSPVEPMACHTNMPSNTCGEDGCSDSCSCETRVEFLVVDNTLISDHTQNNISKAIQIAALSSNLEIIDAESASVINSAFNFEYNSPPRSGKYLVILLQSIKIPFPVS